MQESLAKSDQSRADLNGDCDGRSANSGSADVIALNPRDHLHRGIKTRPVVLPHCPTRKRVFDIAVAILIGIVAMPLIALVSLTIVLSGRPVIFRHWRVGRDKKRFACYKFRTMVPDAGARLTDLLAADPEARREWETNHKLRNDPRVTPFGAFLRQSSIDELPQLWNVIKGDMSLVGPRPIVEDELARYGNRAAYYQAVRPGITGLWQVSGRNDVTYSRRVAFDSLYVRRRSIKLDMWILWRTLGVVFAKVGAY